MTSATTLLEPPVSPPTAASTQARDSLSRFVDDASAQLASGDVAGATLLLERARALSEASHFDDADRARVLAELGCCRLKAGRIPNAVQLLTAALDLCDRCPQPSDAVRIDALRWRSRCYRRQREWEAARADADAAVELAEGLNEAGMLADAYFEAAAVAERSGQLFVARCYLERAVELFRSARRVVDAGKALNNLGGILFLLGEIEPARARLDAALAIAREFENDVDAAYAICSTAQLLVRTGEAVAGEDAARRALHVLAGRTDHVNEIGNAQLVLGRALLAQRRLDEAEQALAGAAASADAMGSLGHVAAVWLAQGDLAATRGDAETAAAFFRRAAEALQDVRF